MVYLSTITQIHSNYLSFFTFFLFEVISDNTSKIRMSLRLFKQITHKVQTNVCHSEMGLYYKELRNIVKIFEFIT